MGFAKCSTDPTAADHGFGAPAALSKWPHCRYNTNMTRLLEQAVAAVSALPDEVQDEVARMFLQFAGIEQAPIQLTPEEDADLAEADAEIARGELATDEQVRAMWAKYDL
jgi:hypothetical protein